MVNLILTDNNLKSFIESLKLSKEHEIFLIDKLPQLDGEERIELLETLKDVYILNKEEDEAIKKIKANWK